MIWRIPITTIDGKPLGDLLFALPQRQSDTPPTWSPAPRRVAPAAACQAVSSAAGITAMPSARR